MKIVIRFRGPISNQLSSPVYHMEISDGSSIGEVFRELIEKEEFMRNIWNSSEKVDKESLILHNDADIGLTGGLNTHLKDGDVIVILPLVHGG